jgi:hypothetical protein
MKINSNRENKIYLILTIDLVIMKHWYKSIRVLLKCISVIKRKSWNIYLRNAQYLLMYSNKHL